MTTFGKTLNILAVTTATFAATLALTACGSESNHASDNEKATPVTTYTPNATNQNGLSISGQVTSKQTAMISTRHMGFVERVLVKQGDAVKAGQLLVTINSEDLKAKRAQAEAMVTEAQAATTNAERDAQRFRNLHAQKSVSDKELENVELNLTSMRAKLQMARQGLQEVKAIMAYTNITAPFSGVVTQKMVDAGSMANPGHPLLVIEQTGDLQITASLPEEYLKYVKTGDAVRVAVKASGREMTGTIAELSPSATMTGGQYALKVNIPANEKANLRSGMYANVQISAQVENSDGQRILVDESSVVRRDQLTGLFIASANNRALLRWVRLGKTVGSQVEVISGLRAGEKIIRPEGQKLRNGQKISIR